MGDERRVKTGSFQGYVIGVVIAMLFTLWLVWYMGGFEKAKTTGIFFLGWVAGATSMYIRKELVEKKGSGHR